MGTKHRHYDVIVAWANGEEVQYRGPSVTSWIDDPDPTWSGGEYRIKPKRVKKEADVVVYKTSDGVIKAYVSFLGPILQVYNAALIKVIPLEWEEEECRI